MKFHHQPSHCIEDISIHLINGLWQVEVMTESGEVFKNIAPVGGREPSESEVRRVFQIHPDLFEKQL